MILPTTRLKMLFIRGKYHSDSREGGIMFPRKSIADETEETHISVLDRLLLPSALPAFY